MLNNCVYAGFDALDHQCYLYDENLSYVSLQQTSSKSQLSYYSSK